MGERFAPAFLFCVNGVRRSGGVPLLIGGYILRPVADIENGLEDQVSDLGFEFVDLDWAGSSVRPVLRLRVDKHDSVPGKGVTIHDCAQISRVLEPWLDSHGALPDRYVLEVSSPGVDRPLIKVEDFRRFQGHQVVLHGHEVLAGRDKRLQGELAAVVEDSTGSIGIQLRLEDGVELTISRSDIQKAHLVFRWK